MPNSEPVLIAGRYRLVTTLATGGMGVVWKGWDERLHRDVAIKQLRVQPGLSPSEAATARDRAMREARNTARLHHPHAVPVYDVVEQDGEPCLIMEFLPSINLQESIAQRGTLPPAEVARIGSELAQALSAAHKAGIVHRDVKPGNVLLAEDGTTKLTDFGISHALGDVGLTQIGMVTGTPSYLAPEVARGQPASFASDVFSLGATLYTATEGVAPFGSKDDNAMAVLHRVASGQFRPPRRSGPLTPLLVRMLAADPRSRPSMTGASQTLAALHADGEAPLRDAPAATRPDATRLEAPRAPAPAPIGPGAPTRTAARPAGRPQVNGRQGRRRRRGPVAVLGIGVLAIAGGVLALALTWPDSNGGSPSKRAGSATQSTSHSPSAPASTSRSAILAQAITDYYALMPTHVQDGWNRLTPAYQQNKSHGYGAYQQFWGQFQRVDVSNVTGEPPSSVQATITYIFKDGHQSTERTGFQLVLSGGQWKIDGSALL